jgi:DNA-binding CsgD family transcriptional regulator
LASSIFSFSDFDRRPRALIADDHLLIEFDYLLHRGKEYKLERKLTCRQREVLHLLGEGQSAKQTGYLLSVRPGTVAFHKYRIMESIGVKTSAGLIQYALKQVPRDHNSRQLYLGKLRG